ncbi:hypothetical protein Tco_0772666 [Tanacetum coccineum]|uniref:Tf2-1-like SH3-like domain-containing protein n=1 Tax=Tanacetum coccineum TaxID=301880 RepID=A0ABQ4ZIQ3_9ASTR
MVRDQQMEKRADEGYTIWIVYSLLVGGVRTKIMDEAHKTSVGQSQKGLKLEHQDVRFAATTERLSGSGENSMELYNKLSFRAIYCAPFEALYGGSVESRLKAARDRQKSYADNRRKPLEFQVGDHDLSRSSRIGPVAYRLRLPKELSSVQDTFHVSNLKKCLADANLHVPLDEIKVDKTLLRWNSKRRPEFTWEREDHMKAKYPQLFENANVETNG